MVLRDIVNFSESIFMIMDWYIGGVYSNYIFFCSYGYVKFFLYYFNWLFCQL